MGKQKYYFREHGALLILLHVLPFSSHYSGENYQPVPNINGELRQISNATITDTVITTTTTTTI